ncbi:unnamed protein product [Ilex paraguariensis]|uniref:Uncharacterized protein n=1 Tax=Ilex paraguariensis TaxID=185542 RepID=A0ABC8QW16_9AQUA
MEENLTACPKFLVKTKLPTTSPARISELLLRLYETVKLIPERLFTYKVFGERRGPHYGHYDLVGGHLAAGQVYPLIIEFLTRHDET